MISFCTIQSVLIKFLHNAEVCQRSLKFSIFAILCLFKKHNQVFEAKLVFVGGKYQVTGAGSNLCFCKLCTFGQRNTVAKLLQYHLNKTMGSFQPILVDQRRNSLSQWNSQ